MDTFNSTLKYIITICGLCREIMGSEIVSNNLVCRRQAYWTIIVCRETMDNKLVCHRYWAIIVCRETMDNYLVCRSRYWTITVCRATMDNNLVCRRYWAVSAYGETMDNNLVCRRYWTIIVCRAILKNISTYSERLKNNLMYSETVPPQGKV